MMIRFPAQRPVESGAADRPCTGCGRPISPGAGYCRRCGMSAAVTTDATSAPVIRLMPWERLRRPVARMVLRRSAGRPSVRRSLPALEDGHSARRTLTHPQTVALRIGIGAIILAVAINALAIGIGLIAVASLFYLGALIYRIRMFAQALNAPDILSVSDAEARGLWEWSLPIYTVLVPAYHEPEVIANLLRHIDRIEYPRARLDVKLLLEEDDEETIAAAKAAITGPHVEIVRIPYSEPRTKPKALNVGLAMARGRRRTGMVTIYDAEDRPDPLQLRRAVVAFRRLPPQIACLQAKLAYHNPDQNMITRWFTVEYSMWFSQLLPGLVHQSAPLPLGGTSNHFRRYALEQVRGWDAYNVTEDADLGIRLHRAGFRTRVLDSTTFEEANSDFVNWVKQRSRWYKGYMQTWLVHMRHPIRLWRELGTWGFLGFNLFVGGTPLLALMNPIFWSLTALWFLARPELIVSLFPAWLYYLSLLCLALGNFAFVYTSMVAARTTGSPKLVLASILSPAYWVMMSIAAIKALIQLFHAPSFWEKTFHGLDQAESTVDSRRAAA
jgi:cellulose synthase/poly-beta-1,6-N-acetylglucosamine synthase-like glycosyltransferase